MEMVVRVGAPHVEGGRGAGCPHHAEIGQELLSSVEVRGFEASPGDFRRFAAGHLHPPGRLIVFPESGGEAAFASSRSPRQRRMGLDAGACHPLISDLYIIILRYDLESLPKD